MGRHQVQNLTRRQSYDIVSPCERSQVLRCESHHCRYAARASPGLAVFDCSIMNASAVSVWDTGLPGLLPLGKDGGPRAGLRAITCAACTACAATVAQRGKRINSRKEEAPEAWRKSWALSSGSAA